MAIRSYSALGMLLPPIIIMAHDYSHALKTINACWVYHVESVSKMALVLSITFCQYMGLHVLNWPIRVQVIERIYFFIFFRGFVSEMVVLPYSVIYYIYISRKLGPCLNYLCSVNCAVALKYDKCHWTVMKYGKSVMNLQTKH